jgi:hypothetical protein
MPQFNSYPAISELLAADLILVYQSGAGAVKTITVEDFAANLKSIASKALVVNEINSATTLDQTYQLVVGNSASSFNVTLPLSSENEGIPFHITNKGAGLMNIFTTALDTLEGQASISLAQYESVIVIADGLDMWHVFGIAN